MLFSGKVVIVTGAGNGLGRSHAMAFAKEGARVVVNDVGGDRSGQGKGAGAADQVVAEIASAGGQAVANHDSVASVEGADRIVWSALAKWGRVDIVVNNAGILRDRTIVNMSRDEFDAVLDVHLRGTFFCTQAAARQMKVQGSGGRIINTTSVSGLMGNFGQGNYAAAKAGIYGLTRTASLELGKMGVTVNAIAPIALTRMTEDIPGITQLGDVTPDKVTPMVLFLASEHAKEITGRIFGCEGGRFFEYWMEQNDGWTKSGAPATVAEIAESFRSIARQKE